MSEHRHEKATERGARHLRESGYQHRGEKNIHGDAKQDEKQIASGVHKHEAHLHKGQPKTKLRHGGKVPGMEAKSRPDRRARGGPMTQPNDETGGAPVFGAGWDDSADKAAFDKDRADRAAASSSDKMKNAPQQRARGGHVGKEGKKGGGKTVINLHVGDGGGGAQKEQMAHQAGMQQGAQMVAAKLTGGGGGAPPGGPPPGAMPPRPPMAGGMPPPGGPPGGMAPGGMPPRPMMPPGGAPPPGMMPPRARGGSMPMRDCTTGRFTGGAVG